MCSGVVGTGILVIVADMDIWLELFELFTCESVGSGKILRTAIGSSGSAVAIDVANHERTESQAEQLGAVGCVRVEGETLHPAFLHLIILLRSVRIVPI